MERVEHNVVCICNNCGGQRWEARYVTRIRLDNTETCSPRFVNIVCNVVKNDVSVGVCGGSGVCAGPPIDQ